MSEEFNPSDEAEKESAMSVTDCQSPLRSTDKSMETAIIQPNESMDNIIIRDDPLLSQESQLLTEDSEPILSQMEVPEFSSQKTDEPCAELNCAFSDSDNENQVNFDDLINMLDKSSPIKPPKKESKKNTEIIDKRYIKGKYMIEPDGRKSRFGQKDTETTQRTLYSSLVPDHLDYMIEIDGEIVEPETFDTSKLIDRGVKSFSRGVNLNINATSPFEAIREWVKKAPPSRNACWDGYAERARRMLEDNGWYLSKLSDELRDKIKMYLRAANNKYVLEFQAENPNERTQNEENATSELKKFAQKLAIELNPKPTGPQLYDIIKRKCQYPDFGKELEEHQKLWQILTGGQKRSIRNLCNTLMNGDIHPWKWKEMRNNPKISQSSILNDSEDDLPQPPINGKEKVQRVYLHRDSQFRNLFSCLMRRFQYSTPREHSDILSQLLDMTCHSAITELKRSEMLTKVSYQRIQMTKVLSAPKFKFIDNFLKMIGRSRVFIICDNQSGMILLRRLLKERMAPFIELKKVNLSRMNDVLKTTRASIILSSLSVWKHYNYR